jgi:hypothetical protein
MERSDTQPDEVTSVNTEINTLTDRAEDPTNEAPVRNVETFWSRLDTLVTHLEESNQHKNKDKLRSFTNQPERVCISSDNDINTAQTQDSVNEQSFNSFRVAIQRPFLDVKSIQLLRASIPNAVTNIPDQECTFWYYRLPVATSSGTISTTSGTIYTGAAYATTGIITGVTDFIDWGTVPYTLKTSARVVRGYFKSPAAVSGTESIYTSWTDANGFTGTVIGSVTRTSAEFLPAPTNKYLHMIRLLPSYYKPELFDTDRGQNISPPPSSPYGWNRTFTDYPDLASELVKSCARDPAYDFAVQQNSSFNLFIPNDISGSYIFNQTLNKFAMTGNNAIKSGVKYATYLSAGYADPNLWTIPTGNITSAVVSGNSIIYTTTSPTTVFYIGMFINITGFTTTNSDDGYNGGYYVTSFTSTTFTVADAFPPASPVSALTNYKQTLWTALPYGPAYLAAITTGAYGLANYDHTLVFGIGGQPFQLYRTLNLRLGFTWNGLITQIAGYFPINIGTLTAQTVKTSVLASFLNRLRPVPLYYTFAVEDTGLSDSPYTSTIYTADNYANLVYTTTVSLYADFTGGSTYDSMANTQLLACVPMNASNLGVTFYNTTLYCPLTKISDQIYEIEIRMLTDTGVPYVIPNSAIVSLELALTY